MNGCQALLALIYEIELISVTTFMCEKREAAAAPPLQLVTLRQVVQAWQRKQDLVQDSSDHIHL